MTIQINEKYRLEQEGIHFNLYFNKPIEKRSIQVDSEGKRTIQKTGENGFKEYCLGYGFSLEKALKVAIMNELTESDEKITLKQWLNEYKELQEHFTKLFINF